jgi:hypothetical protein
MASTRCESYVCVNALGMFARILASGHFNADRIIGIGSGGNSKISDDLLIKILMRADYKLYGDVHFNKAGGYLTIAPDRA